MTPREAAEALGISVCRVHQRIADGTLAAVKIPRFPGSPRWKWDVTELSEGRRRGRPLGSTNTSEKWEIVRQREHWVMVYTWRNGLFTARERTYPGREEQALAKCRERRDKFREARKRALRKARSERAKQRNKYGARDAKTGRFRPRRKQ